MSSLLDIALVSCFLGFIFFSVNFSEVNTKLLPPSNIEYPSEVASFPHFTAVVVQLSFSSHKHNNKCWTVPEGVVSLCLGLHFRLAKC